MKIRKNEAEGALELVSDEPRLFKPAELYNLDKVALEKLSNHNIYLVAKRPRISIDPDKAVIDKKNSCIDGQFVTHVEGQKNRHKFKFKFNFVYSNNREIVSVLPTQYPMSFN